jgi:hypothetical protein
MSAPYLSSLFLLSSPSLAEVAATIAGGWRPTGDRREGEERRKREKREERDGAHMRALPTCQPRRQNYTLKSPMTNCELFYEFDGQRFIVFEFDGQNQTSTIV